ncbi:MAG: hypothetical protein AAFN10_28280, partial [Bacteroidota bacterium]
FSKYQHEMKKVNLLLFCLCNVLLLSCISQSWIAKVDEKAENQFPQTPYTRVLFYHHEHQNPQALSASNNLSLVDSLWAPKNMSSRKLEDLEGFDWQLKHELSKKEISKLRKLFSNQGREYYFKQCTPYAFNRCLVFVSSDSSIVGSIYFCPQGYKVEAYPSLRPGVSKNFIWNESGMEDFEQFLQKLAKKI